MLQYRLRGPFERRLPAGMVADLFVMFSDAELAEIGSDAEEIGQLFGWRYVEALVTADEFEALGQHELADRHRALAEVMGELSSEYRHRAYYSRISCPSSTSDPPESVK
jgi:hypothetical protein